MADSSRTLEIILAAKDQASAVLKNVEKQASSLGTQIKDGLKNNVVELGAAFAGTTAFLVSSIKAYDETIAVNAQLAAVLKSTGSAAGVTASEVVNLAAKLQQQSTFSDEAVISAENLLLTFTKIHKDVFPQATQTVLNMSQALGQDLKSSSIQLGKALQDPILGITALRRVGVNFDDEMKQQIKTLVESGHQLEAQKLILKELATEFGGSALSKAQTFGGQMIILKNNVNDLQELIGGGLLEVLGRLAGGNGFEGVNKALANVNKFFREHHDILISLSAALIAVALVLGGLFLAALAAVAGVSLLVIGAIMGIAAAVVFLGTMIAIHFNDIKKKITDVWDGIIAKSIELRDTIKATVIDWTGVLVTKFTNVRDKVKETTQDWTETTKTKIEGWFGTINALIDPWRTNFKKKFEQTFQDVVDAMIQFDLNTLAEWQTWLESTGKVIGKGLMIWGEEFQLWLESLPEKVLGWLIDVGAVIQIWLEGLPGQITTGLMIAGEAIQLWLEQTARNFWEGLINIGANIQLWLESLPGQFEAGLIAVWDGIMAGLAAIGENFILWWNSLGQNSTTSLTNGFLSGEPSMAAQIVGKLLEFIGLVLATLLIGFIEVALRTSKALGDGIIKGINDFLPKVVAAATSVFVAVKAAIDTKMSEIWTVVSGWWDKIAGIFNSIINKANEAINAVKKGISGATGLHFQHGGFVPGAFNQAVPAILHGGERIVPRTGVDVNSGGGEGVNITFSGPVSMDSSDRVQELADQIISILGRQNELAAKGVSI